MINDMLHMLHSPFNHSFYMMFKLPSFKYL